MATRTAPAQTAAANRRVITFHFIDASGDTDTAAVDVAVAATAADIEALAADLQSATQASLYQITDQLFRNGDADPDNADTDQRNSIKQGINVLLKAPATGDTRELRIFAPVPAVMQGNQDIPLVTGTPLADVLTSWTTLSTGYNAQSVQYTERRERRNNPKVKL